jgi:molecular chaperone DnaK
MAIDFGTSYSSVAVLVDDEPVLLPRPAGCIPSTVGVREDGFTVVGEEARAMRVTDPSSMLASPKRLLGRSYADAELAPYLASLGMLAVEGQGGEIMLRAHRHAYSVEQLCATVIYRLRLYAREHLGVDVTDAVFTIPVSFDPGRTRALTRAAAIAGVTAIKVLEEPAAAALAYRGDPSFNGLVAVYDFGGGTFDFSVVDVRQGLTVVATAGDTWLGGDDFDEALAGAVANAFWRRKGIELRNQAVEWQRLLFAAEQAKRELSVDHQATIVLEDVARTAEGALSVTATITRPQLAELARELVDRSLETCQQALELCGIRPAELNAVYMSGGSSFVPAVLDGVARFFGKSPLISVPPDRAVVLGAAGYIRLLRELQAET